MDWFLVKGIALAFYLETLNKGISQKKTIEEALVETTFQGWQFKNHSFSLSLLPKAGVGIAHTYSINDIYLQHKRIYPASRVGFSVYASHKALPFKMGIDTYYRSPAKEWWIYGYFFREVRYSPFRISLGVGGYINNSFAFGLTSFSGVLLKGEILWRKWQLSLSFISQSDTEKVGKYILYQPPQFHIGLGFNF